MSRLLSAAKSEIAAQLKDYGDGRYDDRTGPHFWAAALQLLNDPDFTLKYDDKDIHGLVAYVETTITSGKIDLTGLTDFMIYREIYPNPENISDALDKVIEEKSLEYFRKLGRSPLVPTHKVLVYRIGKELIFFPAASTTAKKVMVVYVKEPDIDASDGTDLLTYFSNAMVDRIIEFAVENLKIEITRSFREGVNGS